MADDALLKDTLLKVQAGERKFEPILQSPEAIAAFQHTAMSLKTALNSGLIEHAHFIVSKRRDTYNSVVAVVLNSGLTDKGASWLVSPPAKEPGPFRTWLVAHTSEMIFTVIGGLITAIILIAWGLN